MKKLAYFSLFFCFFAFLASCGNPVEPISKETKTFNINDKDSCEIPSLDPYAVPIDCYEWGLQEWPGDDNNGSYRAIQPWLQAAQLDPSDPENRTDLVEIDYFVLYEIDRQTKIETVVDVINYEEQTPRGLTNSEGGIFPRWYTNNVFVTLTNAEISNDRLKVWPSMVPNRICHWWMNSTGKYNRKLGKDYYVKVRLRVTGRIAVQIAADYYPLISSPQPDLIEAFHSNWIGDTGGKFKIFCFPDLTQ